MPHADGTSGLVCRPPECPKLDAIDVEDAADDLASGRPMPLSLAYVACRQADAEASLDEKARLLYVALTRAREALVLSVAAASGKQGVSSALAAQALGALGLPAGCDQVPGVCEVDYGGSAPARVRTVTLTTEGGRGKPKVVTADSAHTLAGYDGELSQAADEAAGPKAPATFDLFEPAGELHLRDVTGWRAREGVFSYSAVHALLAQDGAGEGGRPAVPPVPTRGERDAEEAGAPVTADEDRATNLGSAFHELAQAMAERGGSVTGDEVDARASYWNLSARGRTRLAVALARWEGSELRREALGHALVRAEVPFFCRVDSPYGDYLEGAIDLLATDPGSPEALLVDYKTGDAGLAVDQVRERHAMQARFYAQVLADQGFMHVTCAFVCVEREDPQRGGQPLVVRYEFGG